MTAKTEEKGNRFRNSISLKLIIVVSLSLLLLIPSLKIRQLINEREIRKNETLSEITDKWGKSQLVNGPVLIIPYTKRVFKNKTDYSDHIHYFHILPSNLKIDGEINPDIRYRGIYKVITYNSNLSFTGNFNWNDLSNWPNKYHKILWEDARIVVGISDLKGVTKNVALNWNNKKLKFSPGKSSCTMFTSGINTEVDIQQNSNNVFELKLSLNGSESIYFTPLGSSTEVNITSTWNTPSFDGHFLPQKHEITDSGFYATWSTIEMNRNYPQVWSDKAFEYNYDYQNFGVKLLLPVDTYQKSERSVKYAFLFIALTFLIVFFSEITSKNRVHPIQYLIIGFGLIIFYSLLISLAEHVGFNIAYMLSSLVIIGMITLYIKSLLKKWKSTIIISGALLVLYLFLFTILQVADYALLLGNIGLVIILALVMYFSKKVNWYAQRTIN